MQEYQTQFAPVLRTERLTLRRARMTDARDLYECCRDPQMAKYVLWDAHTSVSDTRGYVRYLLRQYRNGDPPTLAVEVNETGKVIGTIGFAWLQPENRSAEVGYSIGREYWNRGYMTEALFAFLDWCFGDLNLNRVEAQHDLLNPASGRVMEKAGMRKEGEMRQRVYLKGRYADVAVYAALKQDWRKK